jgi:hypothetical protein
MMVIGQLHGPAHFRPEEIAKISSLHVRLGCTKTGLLSH